MNSPYAKMYLEIAERLKVAVATKLYVNMELGQLEGYELRPAVSFPCVLIDFTDFNFSDMGENCQIGEGNVILRIAFTPYSNTSNITPQAFKEKGLKYFEIETEIYKALQGWQGEDFGALMRESDSTEKREDDIRVRQLVFSTTFQDNLAAYHNDTVTATLDIEEELVEQIGPAVNEEDF